MSTNACRAWLLVAAIAGALLTIASFLEYGGTPRILGVWGCTFAAGDGPFQVRVASVDSRGPAKKAGLEPGDTIDLRRYGFMERIGILQQPVAGVPLQLYLQRNGKTVQTTVVPVTSRERKSHAARVFFYSTRTYDIGLFLMCIYAALIAWRRCDRRHARVLSLMLSMFVIGENSSPQNILLPWPGAMAVLELVSQVAYVLPIPLFALFACSIAQPLSRARAVAEVTTYVFAGAALVIGIGIAVGITFLWIDPVGLFYKPVWTMPQNAAYVAALVCGFMAIAAAQGAERQLVAWATWSVTILFVCQIVATVGEEIAPTYNAYVAYVVIGNTGVFLAPIGLSYALLNRRLLDIGFALNRAAVFTALSVIIVGTFFVVEWALSEWIRDVSHLTGVVVNVTLALVLGFSIRAIHSRVDHLVDQVFFRKRYEDEQALRDFAQEAAFISNPVVLVQRAIAEVEDHAGATGVDIVLADDPRLDRDDEALVALRTFHRPVELRKYQTALKGEYGFPMSSRGDLIGVLVCGLKRGGEAYAPDEFDAIAQLARSVGAALDVLHAKQDGTLSALLAMQREVLETLNGIRAALMPREVL
ncbi:MAG TPA: hypothetical protein VGZ02_06590 [Candidatus Baltobacteraceae bacterium]|jgi:hypothetical protein|nr:hypothetical protein [Candidatus Baltobacteraceae bacterium]